MRRLRDRGARRGHERHQALLAANGLGRALYAPVFDGLEQPANTARFAFLDPTARDFYPDWERLASDLVATLRSHAGRNPYDRVLRDLIGELSTRSDESRLSPAAKRRRWCSCSILCRGTPSNRRVWSWS